MSDLIPDSYYDWIFVANTGDQYAGIMYNDTGAYAPGQVLPTAYATTKSPPSTRTATISARSTA